MWDHDPVLKFLKENVHDAVPELDEPPAADEGWIQAVEFDRVDATALEHDKAECQHCGEPVHYAEPHVWVHAILEGRRNLKHHKRGRLCDRECWAAWASSR